MVGPVEERLQFVPGECPLGRVGLGLLDVDGGIPLVNDLDRMGAKPLLALRRPSVDGIGDVAAEQPDRDLVTPQRRPARPPDSSQVGHPLINQGRRPLPGERARVGGERTDGPLSPFYCRER